MLRIVLGGVVLIALLIFSLGTALVVGLQGRFPWRELWLGKASLAAKF